VLVCSCGQRDDPACRSLAFQQALLQVNIKKSFFLKCKKVFFNIKIFFFFCSKRKKRKISMYNSDFGQVKKKNFMSLQISIAAAAAAVEATTSCCLRETPKSKATENKYMLHRC
jgi:hypothetical protein